MLQGARSMTGEEHSSGAEVQSATASPSAGQSPCAAASAQPSRAHGCMPLCAECVRIHLFLSAELSHSEGSELVVLVINKTKDIKELKRLQYSFDDNFDDFSRDDSPDLV